MPDNYYNIIVGGGLAGLFAAKFLSRNNKNVVIVEHAPRLGGLMNSVSLQDPEGDSYDFDLGTHFLLMTGHEEIDCLIENDMDLEEWQIFKDSLHEGHVFNNSYYENSGCLNAKSLPQSLFDRGVEELTSLAKQNKTTQEPENLYTALLERYGQVFADNIYVPSFEKFSGMHPKELSPSFETTFGPGRIIISDREGSIKLKKDPAMDWRVAYADHRDGASDIVKRYPKKGGIGKWVQNIQNSLEKQGVRILTNASINSFEYEEGMVKTVELSTAESVKCERLIWSAPPLLLAKQLKIDVPSTPPKFRSVTLLHFLIDEKPVSKAHWVNVHDPNLKSFRVTFYDNFQSQIDRKLYRITVEILHEPDDTLGDIDTLKNTVFEELQNIELLSKTTKHIKTDHQTLKMGFPVMSPNAEDIWRQQFRILEEKLSNTLFIGRHPDIGFKQIPIITSTYDKLRAI